ncbi:hypothetical protein BN13_650008 [Nostocoides jenkinsii Ben 74]|uniref:Uncharacterized protein n=1 Tax=Nostocoides jenkinsii Ben 74 TaxID=1193518 RepID=A0A077ME57_9MICO|nr:hypothetical protein BN13_650008 [Tetrasphaera jenkinsii Ben 74]
MMSEHLPKVTRDVARAISPVRDTDISKVARAEVTQPARAHRHRHRGISECSLASLPAAHRPTRRPRVPAGHALARIEWGTSGALDATGAGNSRSRVASMLLQRALSIHHFASVVAAISTPRASITAARSSVSAAASRRARVSSQRARYAVRMSSAHAHCLDEPTRPDSIAAIPRAAVAISRQDGQVRLAATHAALRSRCSRPPVHVICTRSVWPQVAKVTVSVPVPMYTTIHPILTISIQFGSRVGNGLIVPAGASPRALRKASPSEDTWPWPPSFNECPTPSRPITHGNCLSSWQRLQYLQYGPIALTSYLGFFVGRPGAPAAQQAIPNAALGTRLVTDPPPSR